MGHLTSCHSPELELRLIFQISEDAEAAELVTSQMTFLQRVKRFLLNMDKQQFETLMDTVVGIVILFNALFIGLSVDKAGPNPQGGWLIADITFTTIFSAELILKVFLHGPTGQFCGGKGKRNGHGRANYWRELSNWFDACLVIFDVMQLTMSVDGAPPASLFRVVRLLRLMRLLKLVRSPIFSDLLSMVQGMLGGMKTLFWAIVLFMLVVYVVALVFREVLGRGQIEAVSIYFDTVPRSMFTTFRCSFGDCTTDGGAPIFEGAYTEAYTGYGYSLLYCGFVFFITVGLFNVIAAIFVESTMNSAAGLEKARKTQRSADQLLWANNVSKFISCMCEVAGSVKNADGTGELSRTPSSSELSQTASNVISHDFPVSVIDECVTLPRAKEALRNLDICEDDFGQLSDILDPDNGGSLGVLDVVDGLRRLRGDPRRSDIVTIDLMIRSMQGVFHEIRNDMEQILASVSNSKKKE